MLCLYAQFIRMRRDNTIYLMDYNLPFLEFCNTATIAASLVHSYPFGNNQTNNIENGFKDGGAGGLALPALKAFLATEA